MLPQLNIFSLLSSCSSFRDSTFDENRQEENVGEEAADLNGINKKFKGINMLSWLSGFTKLTTQTDIQ